MKLSSNNIQESFAPRLAGWCIGGYSYSSTRPGSCWLMSLDIAIQALGHDSHETWHKALFFIFDSIDQLP